jgi:exodeoxyribonuclease VII small subunit
MAKKDSSKAHEPEHQAEESLESIQTMSFEQAMAELEQISARLDANELSLAGSLAAYQRGGQLLAHAKALLESVQTQIEVIDEQGRRSVPSHTFLADDGPPAS